MARSRIVGMPRGRLAVALRDVDAPQRAGLVAPLPQVAATAVAFFAGVSQVTPSTPGVVLPWFSVTRRTARALPLNEWVSRCCKALPCPSLPSCVAFTIRAWSRRTFSMDLPPVDGVPVHLLVGEPHQQRAAMLPSSACLLGRLAKLSREERPDGSLPAFARGDVARWRNPYPPHYRAAFAFSARPLPAPPSAPLAGRFPLRGAIRAYHVPPA